MLLDARMPDTDGLALAAKFPKRDKDAPQLREAAHKLAGMVAMFFTVAGGVCGVIGGCSPLSTLPGQVCLIFPQTPSGSSHLPK